ncbi:hypothetical protein B566_EDAN010882 [Ephemera danica]|nr:hypothetical protein B566_EDAN010882 [Ephemera danica]
MLLFLVMAFFQMVILCGPSPLTKVGSHRFVDRSIDENMRCDCFDYATERIIITWRDLHTAGYSQTNIAIAGSGRGRNAECGPANDCGCFFSRTVVQAKSSSRPDGPAQEDPEFTDYIENITVPAGRNVKLACSVKNLGTYKISEWSHVYGVVYCSLERRTNSCRVQPGRTKLKSEYN